jgi:hypothetical protein
MVLLFWVGHISVACEQNHMTLGPITLPRVCTIYNSTKAKQNSHVVWWCAAHTTIEVSMERVFGVTVNCMLQSSVL